MAIAPTKCFGSTRNCLNSDSNRTIDRGFTLIELLVVVAIVSILASLVIVGLAQAKAKADSTVCKNNVRQITLGLHLYVADFDTYLPPDHIAGNSPKVRHWFEVLEPYTGAKWPEFNLIGRRIERRNGLYACPGYSRFPGVFMQIGRNSPMFNDTTHGAYGYNTTGVRGHYDLFGTQPQRPLGLAGGTLPKTGEWVPVKENNVANPADMFAFMDTPLHTAPMGTTHGVDYLQTSSLGDIRIYWGFYDTFLNGNPRAEDTKERRAHYKRRHGARFNVGLADGHVESLGPEKVFRSRVNAVTRRWNNDNQPHFDQF